MPRQVPQLPPQPSSPHCFPLQLGEQLLVQRPAASQLPLVHVPQVPPHPSGPHCLPAQEGRHDVGHWPAASHVPLPQLPHDPPQPSGPQSLPVQLGTQAATHWPSALQLPEGQEPQEPPQLSGPQALPAQLGLQDGLVSQASPVQPGSQMQCWSAQTPRPLHPEGQTTGIKHVDGLGQVIARQTPCGARGSNSSSPAVLQTVPGTQSWLALQAYPASVQAVQAAFSAWPHPRTGRTRRSRTWRPSDHDRTPYYSAV